MVALSGSIDGKVEVNSDKGNKTAKFVIAVKNGNKDPLKIACNAFGKAAENVEEKGKKGQGIAVSGRLVQKKFEDKNGQQRQTVEVNARSIEFVNGVDADYGINAVELSGRLTADPIAKYIGEGDAAKPVANFSLAVNYSKDDVSFFNCTAWDRTAEIVGEYGSRSRVVNVEGRINQRFYEKDGETREVIELNVDNVGFLDKANRPE